MANRKDIKKKRKPNKVEQDTIINTRDIARLKKTVESLNVTGGEDLHYTHTQTGAASVWTVNHNLDKFPSVMVSDSGNNVVIGDIEYIDANTLTISFTASFSGYAFLN